MQWQQSTTPATNIIIPLTMESLRPGPAGGRIVFGLNVRKQYYNNVVMEFRVPDAACLRMAGIPVQSALVQVQGEWRERYSQDKHFQQIGQVLESPAWKVDPREQRLLISTEIEASIGMEFYPFVLSVKENFQASHDTVIEVFGRAFVHKGYPKEVDGITQYGTVDFELVRFEAIYIVPKGGPSGTRYLS